MQLCNINIRESDGLFSLNDLHKASGGEDRHQPTFFLRNEQTKALIEALESDLQICRSPSVQETAGIPASLAIKVVKGNRADGTPQGTFVCRELVVAYAAWISAAFHLKVLRVFLNSEAPKKPVDAQVAAHAATIDLLVGLGVRKELAMATALTAIHLDTGITTEGYRLLLPPVEDICNLNQTQLGDLAGVSSREIGKRLRSCGMMMIDDESGQRVITEYGKKYGEMKPYNNNGHSGYEPRWRKEVLNVIAAYEIAE